MATSPDLGVPYIANQQAQPEVTHNDAINMLLALFKGVLSVGDNAPPGSPAEGDSYVVGDTPTGDWAGQANKIAMWIGGAWLFVPGLDSDGTPIDMGARQKGLMLYDQAGDSLYIFDGTSWNAFTPGGGAVSLVQSKGFVGDQPGTDGMTPDTDVTPGNLLVVMGTHWGNNPSPASGWAGIYQDNGASHDGLVCYCRIATPGDVGAALKPVSGGTSGQCLALFELSGALAALPIAYDHFKESTATSKSLAVGSGKSGSRVIAFFSTDSSNTAPTSVDNGTVLSTVTGTTSNRSPRQITLVDGGALAAGAGLTLTANYAASVEQFGFALVVAPA